MSENATMLLTQHAMLVAWGEYAQSIGLVKGIAGVPLDQKEIDHSPQRKVLEFLVAILGGLPYLKGISRSAHPLDQDLAVSKAWGQDGWADQSSVSRTLSALTMAQAEQIVDVLRQVSQPFIDREVVLALCDQGKVVYDGDRRYGKCWPGAMHTSPIPGSARTSRPCIVRSGECAWTRSGATILLIPGFAAIGR